jgi:hypothetical protein
VIVTVRAELVGLLELCNVLSEAFSALLAGKDHLVAFFQRVALLFTMALDAVKPFSATWRSNSNLGIENVFTHDENEQKSFYTCEVVSVNNSELRSGVCRIVAGRV